MLLTPEEMQAKQLEIQQQGIKFNLYIGIAGLVISALSLYWMSQPKN